MSGLHPVEQVQWVPVEKLKPNDYNPNYVPRTELELLYKSIKYDGWTQPIVVDEEFNIVDGFHRYKVASTHPDILRDGCVPVVILRGKSRAEKMVSTVRHNRARGNHEIMAMADIVASLSEHYTDEQIADILGMEQEEIDRLKDRRNAPEIFAVQEFSRGWIPDHTPDRDPVLKRTKHKRAKKP